MTEHTITQEAAHELLREAQWAYDLLTEQFAMDCEGTDALKAAIQKARGE